MREQLQITRLFDLSNTIAAEIFAGKSYPWEILPLIGDYVLQLGNTLSEEEYELSLIHI